MKTAMLKSETETMMPALAPVESCRSGGRRARGVVGEGAGGIGEDDGGSKGERVDEGDGRLLREVDVTRETRDEPDVAVGSHVICEVGLVLIGALFPVPLAGALVLSPELSPSPLPLPMSTPITRHDVVTLSRTSSCSS